jgi:glycosyltransferase involved in cell wall biosynthesis
VKISVVVPAHNAAGALPRLLASLDAQTLDRSSFEVVVVDNASVDETATAATKGGARVVSEARPSRSRARNAGVAAARSDRVAFIDAECRADPGWLSGVLACLEKTPLVAGPVRVELPATPSPLERFDHMWRFHQREHVERDGWAASANLAITREAFEAIGGFDPAYRHIGEDVDLCLRAGAAGYPIGFCAGAWISHPAEGSLEAMLRRGYRQGWSMVQHHYRLPGEIGGRLHFHPGPLVRGDWALRRFGVDPASFSPEERRAMLRLGRLEYAARMVGSLHAELSPRRAR